MGRSKAVPTRRSQTGTIVGAAAISASSSSPASALAGRYAEDARHVLEVAASRSSVGSSSCSSYPFSSSTAAAAAATATVSPSRPRHQPTCTNNAALVTPSKSDLGPTRCRKSTSRLRKVTFASSRSPSSADAIVPRNLLHDRSIARSGDDDDDDDAMFSQSQSSSTKAASTARMIVDDDEDIGGSSSSVAGSRRLAGKRRIFDDDGHDEGEVGLEEEKEGEHMKLSIVDDEGATLIHIPPSIVKSTPSSASNAHVLMRFRLPKTRINITSTGKNDSSNDIISLATKEATEAVLNHCNQVMGPDKSLDIGPILRAVEDGLLEIALHATPPAQSQSVNVSILLPASCLDKLSPAFQRGKAPPIPTPRKLPGNSARYTQPHPSYTLMLALGKIFEGSIFDDVGKSLANPQPKKGHKDFITAKMVYSVVDNVHAHEFEVERSDDSSLDIPGLVPTLRPYQEAAVRWMLKREGKDDTAGCTSTSMGSNGSETSDNAWELCWTVIECPSFATGDEDGSGKRNADTSTCVRSQVISLPDWKSRKCSGDVDLQQIFVNPSAGWLASTYEEAKRMMLGNKDKSQGGEAGGAGILAESMGLGKSVEVIACMLANPSPLALHNAPGLPVQTHVESNTLNDNVGDDTTSATSNDIHTANEQKRQKFAKNPPAKRRATKSSAMHAVCICGRSAPYKDCLTWVICEECGEAIHGRCAGFGSDEDLLTSTKESPGGCGARTCARDHCPSCCFASASEASQNRSTPIVKSRATLIVTPPAILTQWQREISRHTKNPATGRPLKVVIYPGVRELCRIDSSCPHDDVHLIHPRSLADADVVLLTFQTLMSDLGHSDDNPFTGFGENGSSRLRSRKRYRVLPSPLTQVVWWRVCLDEAQRVEAPTAASARMAHKLIASHRWCVSGTPIGRGRLDDLYGLLLFLNFKPFDEKKCFSNSFNLSHGDALKRLTHLLQDVMWRSTKANAFVRQQMGIPEQEERKIVLQFSSVEKYFYERQYQETMGAAQRVMASESSNSEGARPKKSKTRDFDLLNHALQKLRAACCHPQVGTSGIGGRLRRQQGSSIAVQVLSMDQILEKLIDDAKAKCEEAQRIATLHTNGMACLTKLKADTKNMGLPGYSNLAYSSLLRKSLGIYQEALDMADENASPTEAIGSAVLGGSIGFRLNKKTINNGAATLDWQIKPSVEENAEILDEVWSSITFMGPAKAISCVKVRTVNALPPELQGEVASSWTVVQPKELVLQMSSAAVGGDFVDVRSFTLSDDSSESGQWKIISGFRSSKSKAWRLVIKSYHDVDSLFASNALNLRRYYIGLDVEFFEPEIAVDSLQKLHILTNAGLVLSSLVQADDSAVNDGTSETLKRMESEARAISDNYMAHARAVHRESKRQLTLIVKAREKCDKELKDLSVGSNRPWYEDALAYYAINGDDSDRRALCEAVRHDLMNYYDYEKYGGRSGASELKDQTLTRRGRFPDFNNVDGLHVALAMRIQQGEDEVGLGKDKIRTQCMQSVLDLSPNPTDMEVYANSHCRRCREDWQQTGPVCSHCHLEDDLVKFQRLSNDPEILCILKAIGKFVKDRNSKAGGGYLEMLSERASKFFVLQGKIREEVETAKLAWKTHFDLLSDIDELNQCKRAMRLRQEGEDVSELTENEAAFIIDPSNIATESMEHEVKQATALAELRRSKDSLRYLKNQRRERKSAATTQGGDGEERSASRSNVDTCTICLAGLDGERAVLSCGHFYHPQCIETILRRSGGGTVRCPMRCAILTKREDVMLATDKSKEDGSRISKAIEGDWGTKVNRLVGDVMDAIHMGDKGIIFSQWEAMMDIVATALEANQVAFIRPKSGKRFGEDTRRFRSSDCPILLMNVKNGAEGLTLTEANHVFMIEPILNCGLDLQAINRIHRIGQTSKTYVHRYIVADTVEEKIDAIRMERQENHFEDDLQEQKKHSIKGGGIDGGFDVSELHQLFE